MIGYVTIGANDLERSWAFYDKVFEPLGGKGSSFGGKKRFYSAGSSAMVAVGAPFDGEPATAGNGSMFGFAAPSPEKVDEVYAAAIAAGATCDGKPGARMPTFYGAYFRDPDGNKICIFKMG